MSNVLMVIRTDDNLVSLYELLDSMDIDYTVLDENITKEN